MSRVAAYFALAFIACGEVDGAPPSRAPENRCPDHPCASYANSQATCMRGVCVVDAKLLPKFTLVVSVPDGAATNQDESVVLSSEALNKLHATEKCPHPDCVVIPSPGTASGVLQVTPAVARTVGRPLGNTGLTVIPVRATFRPLADATGHSIAMLPLTPVRARVLRVGDQDQLELKIADGATGPAHGVSLGYGAVFPPGQYERTIEPAPPFDDSFPPYVDALTLGSGRAGATVETLGQGEFQLDPNRGDRTLDISASVGQPLEGWRAYLRDTKTGQRVSSKPTLHGSKSEVTLQTIGYPSDPNDPHGLQSTELVVSPPEGAVALPTLAAAVLSGVPTIAFPRLPTPVTLLGTVRKGDQSPVAAEILFVSTRVKTADASSVDYETRLHYETRISTDDRGGFGCTRCGEPVLLPPGSYKTVVIPRDRSAGVLRGTFEVAVAPRLQTMRDFTLPGLVTLGGRARVADGRGLAAAEIEARPSPSRGKSGSSHMRDAVTMTSDDGSFSMQVDTGTYNLFIRPHEGSGLPWVVMTGKDVGDQGLLLDAPIVPAPSYLKLTLNDSAQTSNPLAHAIVRAYATPESGGVPVEIGRALTDDNGKLEMFLAGLPK